MPSTLADIRTKVRRITKSPQEAQLSTANLDDYINTFVLYDFPEQLRLFYLRTTLTFWTKPYVDTYTTTTANVNDPLYNFKNKYVSVHPPFYIGGYPVWFTQSQQEFFGSYPFVNYVNQEDTGDGIINFFSGTLTNFPILRGKVTFTSIDANNNALTAHDVPITDTTGNLVDVPTGVTIGSINYVTGVWDVTFIGSPGNGQPIWSETVPYVTGIPSAIMYFDYTFTVRPVPDKAYPVNFEVYIRPTALLDSGQSPQLEQWWQYIALGAAKKIFEDRTQYDRADAIMNTFKEQEMMVLRSTLVQLQNERSATIYTQQTGLSGGPWNYGGNNGIL